MATTIDYASDYGGKANDYQMTMAENPSATIDYDSLTKLCPLMMACAWMPLVHDVGVEDARIVVRCSGPRCAWYDADKSRCAVLSIARNK